MSIEINGHSTTGVRGEGAIVRSPRTDNSGASANTKDNGVPQDTVTLTVTSDLQQRLDAEVAAATGIDTARVNRVRNAIDDGSFTVDAERVAAKLVKTELAIDSRGVSRKA